MKWTSTIQQIGKKALSQKDNMVILFGESNDQDLADVSVIQKFAADTPISNFVFKKGDTITINGVTYISAYVGTMVVSNMKVLAHATLYFNQAVPKHPLANAIYFEKDQDGGLPSFNLNDDLVYEHI